MWQCGRYLGAGWASTAGVYHIWSSTTGDQRHPLQEASSWLFPVKSSKQTAMMCWNRGYHLTPAALHPAAGPFCQSELAAVRQKTCWTLWSSAQLHLEELDFCRTAQAWQSSHCDRCGVRWKLGPWLLSLLLLYRRWPFSFCPQSLSISICCPPLLHSVDTTLSLLDLTPITLVVFFHDEHYHLVLEVFGRS